MRRALLAIGLVLGAALRAAAISAPHVQVDLVADVQSIRPGHPIALGLRFVAERGWHVYWRNPGDSGEAPSIRWTLPPGFRASDLRWPAPERIPVGPLANFGYEGTVVLPVDLDVPADLHGTGTVDLRADARWLVCNEDECIPGWSPLVLSLPVGDAPPAPSNAAGALAAARSRVPVAAPAEWKAAFRVGRDTIVLELRGLAGPWTPAPLFFPFGRDVIEHAAPQRTLPTDDGLRLELQRSSTASAPPPALGGVLVAGGRAYEVHVANAGAGLRLEPLLLALAGGLLLNLMPCVFPVLAIKAVGLLGLAGDGRREARGHGVAYTAGVLASFWALAGVLLAVRAGGAPLGWGFQLQSPMVVAALAALFFWLSLMLLGFTTAGGSLMGVGNQLAAAGGYRGAFFTGVLATVVATPCSAPFMGAALGYALVQPAAVALAVFTALGLGLALPYLVLAFVPALGSRLPRPGRWMETLKELLAFPLLGTVVWLTWVASVQGGPAAVAGILTILVLLGLVAWVGARWPGRWSGAAGVVVVGVALLVAASIERVDAPARAATSESGWEPYSSARLGELLAQGRPVFVDFTAAWCVTCQVNERLVLARPEVRDKMQALGVVAVRADWTVPDPDITRALQQFGRDGVPLYVLYSGRENDPPRILPQILTTEVVITELDQLDTRSRT